MPDRAQVKTGNAEERIYKIGEVVEMTGLTHRTLHYYEELGLLGKREQRQGHARVYTAREVERLQMIQQWQQWLGFSLKKIKQILDMRQTVERLLEEAHREPHGPIRQQKLRAAREKLQTQLDIVESHLEKLAGVRKRMRATIARIDKELEA